ncbi:MAG: hypothetical protein WAK90_15705 [Pseudolabrys sp.]
MFTWRVSWFRYLLDIIATSRLVAMTDPTSRSAKRRRLIYGLFIYWKRDTGAKQQRQLMNATAHVSRDALFTGLVNCRKL